MINQSKSICLSLLFACNCAFALADNPNYEIRPNCAGAKCRPTEGWGFVDTNWREWPGQPHPEQVFPRSIGHTIIPPPPGKVEKPLPDASVVTPKPEVKPNDAGGSPAAPIQGGGSVLPLPGSTLTPAGPGMSVPGAALPNPGAGGIGTGGLGTGGPGLGGIGLPDTSGKAPGDSPAAPKSDSSTPAAPTFGKQPGSDGLPGLGTPDKSPAPMPDKPQTKSLPDDVPSAPGAKEPTPPSFFPNDTPKSDGRALPKPSDRSAKEEAPMGPMLEPAVIKSAVVNSAAMDEPVSYKAVKIDRPAIQATWNTALASESAAGVSLQKAGYIDESKSTINPKRCAVGGYSPVQLCDSERWVAGNVKINCEYHGRTYLFADQADREKFLANPQKYIPSFNGYDPVLAYEHQAEAGSVQHSALWNGRLYLFSSSDTLASFKKKPAFYAAGE